MSSRDTATAYEAWQKQWSTGKGRARWIEPEPDVMAVADRWRGEASKTALDLGCGVGRHALYLASQGFTVFGLDGSQRGIDVTREEALGVVTRPAGWADDAFALSGSTF